MSKSDSKPTVVLSKKTATHTSAKNLFDDVSPKEPVQASRRGDSLQQKTVMYGETSGITAAEDANMTVLAHLAHAGEEASPLQDCMRNPVVGWVVVLAGPGKGRSLPLGYGANALGRATNQRVCLDFGDKQISRENHALITYEPKGRIFYLQNGGSLNLTYLQMQNDCVVPVLTPVVLEHGQCFQLGDTTLKFIALCGSEFDWNDLA